ncbi:MULTISPECIES: SDR family NAD(P)-dependent oxidoreductase [unclassified Chelatococcus]|uniref:SDR family NAD(P)-dependent oxidoreductase n=1 Tax=unclassified Chelatococcus TaxID=2638111 RepID=UPI0020C16CBE|nr:MULTISPECIES: SDR family NAD(P)-dependent oxidoreductase [unclassified Chelatococcus]
MFDKPASDLLRLDGRNAVITGGARGIGRAIAARLAEAGAAVAIGDLDGAAAEVVASALAASFGVRTYGGALDVSDPAAIRVFAECAEKATGPLTVWVNNAGIYPVSQFLDMDVSEWDKVIAVNLRGTFLGAQEAARRMIAFQNAGRVILNISSVSGYRGRAGLAHYTASKHGVVGLTKSLAIELGPRGIRVLSIAPTLVPTPGIKARHAGDAQGQAAQLEATLARQLPLGRVADEDDIAQAALFCVSDMASLVTGTTLFVDAGATAH